jgi:hypothetical protein
LAVSLYSDLDPNALVMYEDRIQGVISGIEQQIDVSIYDGRCWLRTARVCAGEGARSPPDVNIVGDFHAVIRRPKLHNMS